MTALTFRMRGAPPCRLDVSALLPGRLSGMSIAGLARVALARGREPVLAGDVFEISGDDPAHIHFVGDCSAVDFIGAGLDGGRITVDGPAGAYVAAGMSRGEVFVAENAQAYAGASMSGGSLRIRGNAGDRLGGARTGETAGMRGGRIHVAGGAGEGAGHRMRRGLIVIEGDCGPAAGSEMIAGTLVILGQAGAHPGFLMRRGSILLGRQAELLPGFLDAGVHDFAWLRVLERHLAATGLNLADRLTSRARRYAGDMAALGKGEILMLAR